ncbi:peptide deformylase [Herbiconiux moechotypicola]|uniref:Peptide deformylase n=1 Tax=Herbiconiux moechotypicola TaxID=637393 RepID=A0ABN3D6Z0_9MICO|nr:peptide deformylase [Herbiconiux moechotypicola]MCS5728511.1 peptide deformylase [Herbiconiux moechotypicola]
MAVLPILISGDPVLHTPASPVGDVDDTVRTLVADMFETMDAAPGVGLAAPQVGVPLRLFVYGWTDDADVLHRGVAVNPELFITPTTTEPADDDHDVEGCLSFPGERFPLVRGTSAILRATDLDGSPFVIEASGWLARIFQHEFDHLEGRLYVDRLEHAYAKVAAKVERKSGWGVPGLSWLPGRDDLDA